MADAPKTTVQVGPGLLGLLTLLFVACKLFHVISWSWWLVLLPLWGPAALVLVVLLLVFVGAVIHAVATK